MNSNHDISSIEIPGYNQISNVFDHDTLVEMSRYVVNEITLENILENKLSSQARRDLALRIEQLLWLSPSECDDCRDITLDELTEILNVSRRSIQLAVQEQLGLGFVALKKIIRLYQMRAEMIKQGSYKSITTMANEHNINHPRVRTQLF